MNKYRARVVRVRILDCLSVGGLRFRNSAYRHAASSSTDWRAYSRSRLHYYFFPPTLSK